jgi:sulfite reductase beta subunit-like hemoprotein
MQEPTRIAFPCQAVPADPAEARLLGIYPQRREGMFLQRVKVLGGRIRPGQLRGLALLARRYSGERLLHLTTRQDIEIRSLRPEDFPAVQSGIHGLGLTTVGACGDTVRNITVCPHNGFCRGTWDVSGLAEAIYAHAEAIPWVRQLPRKFKIGLCSCPAHCARPWTNDLGLAANADGTFQAVLAGSLGARPNTGLLVYRSLAAGEVLPLVTAALRLFYEEGDRRVRARARLRHVRERLGNEAFCRRIDELFCAEKKLAAVAPPAMSQVQTDIPLQAHLHLPLGDLDPGIAEELCAAAEETGAELRIGLDHDLLVFGRSPLRLPAAVALLQGGPTLVACPGAETCTKGIANSRDAARRIRSALPTDCGLSIHVSGCPNNCVLSATADIGLIGRIRQVDQARVESFRLLVGGGNGRSPALGRELHSAVPARGAERVVAWLVDEHQQASATAPISWEEFVERDFSRLAERLSGWLAAERIEAPANEEHR